MITETKGKKKIKGWVYNIDFMFINLNLMKVDPVDDFLRTPLTSFPIGLPLPSQLASTHPGRSIGGKDNSEGPTGTLIH